MSSLSLTCPDCYSESVVKNGKTRSGKQNYKCKDCGRQFVQNPQDKKVDQSTKQLIDKLLREDISLVGIARVASVSEPWLRNYIRKRQQP